MQPKYTIGLDFGSDSVRALIVNTANGNEIASSVFEYPRWKQGLFCNPKENSFRQHPKDYLEGLEYCLLEVLKKAPQGTAESIVAISVDTTGSTPVAVDEQGVPLALTPGFEENPNAMFILWKDHTALEEADEINQLAKRWDVDYTLFSGGIYSSEWFWAKLLHVLREDPAIYRAAYSWVEHCDWIPALLTGNTNPKTLLRSRCAAGHKAMWHEKFGGLPSEEFLIALDPMLGGLRDRLYRDTYPTGSSAGYLSNEWSQKLNLPQQVVIGVGALDAHMGAVGAGVREHRLVKVMGTSTCDLLVSPLDEQAEAPIHGICGQVNGSIIPDMLGLEAGQSAFGDLYAWFKNLLMEPVRHGIEQSQLINQKQAQELIDEIDAQMLARLSEQAAKLPIEEQGVWAIDWINGRRTPNNDQKLKGAIAGLNMGTDAPRIFRSLIEATAFGSKAIIDHFKNQGIRIDEMVALGGVAKKSPLVMQILSDILNMPIQVARSEQACALGSAMSGAVAAGIYTTMSEAREKMASPIETSYFPIRENVEKYKSIGSKYIQLAKCIENFNH